MNSLLRHSGLPAYLCGAFQPWPQAQGGTLGLPGPALAPGPCVVGAHRQPPWHCSVALASHHPRLCWWSFAATSCLLFLFVQFWLAACVTAMAWKVIISIDRTPRPSGKGDAAVARKRSKFDSLRRPCEEAWAAQPVIERWPPSGMLPGVGTEWGRLQHEAWDEMAALANAGGVHGSREDFLQSCIGTIEHFLENKSALLIAEHRHDRRTSMFPLAWLSWSARRLKAPSLLGSVSRWIQLLLPGQKLPSEAGGTGDPHPGTSRGRPGAVPCHHQPTMRWPSRSFHPHPLHRGASREAGLSQKVVCASSGEETKMLDGFPLLSIPSCCSEDILSTAPAFSGVAACSAGEQRTQAGSSNVAQQSRKYSWPRWLSSCSKGSENVTLGRNDVPVVSPH